MRHLCRKGASKIWSNYDDKNTRLYPIKNSPRKFKKRSEILRCTYFCRIYRKKIQVYVLDNGLQKWKGKTEK